MAIGLSCEIITLGAFLLIGSFYPILANRIIDEAQFKWPDRFRNEPMKERQLHPNAMLPKRSEAPFRFYTSQTIQAILPEQLARQRQKRWLPNEMEGNSFEKEEAQIVEDERMAKPQPGHRQGSALRKFIKSNQEKRLKRSFSHLYTYENNFDDKFLSNMLKTKKQKRKESYARMFRKKREDEEAEDAPSVRTVHFRITALQTQKKLAEMIDFISDPSNHIPKGENLAYMHELLNELNTFSKLLQQQIQLQSPEEASSMATPTSPPAT